LINFPEVGPDDEFSKEVIEHEAPATDRSFARRIALQVLYELDTTAHRVGEVIAYRLDAQETDKKESRYVRFLVQGVLNHQEALDGAIRKYMVEWPLEQIAALDRNILRMAVLEFAVEEKAPISVVIDEAVGLARVFSAESSIGFVNGVLGKLATDDETMRQLRALKIDGEFDV
jgi:N utilization substance protein B